MLFMNDYYADPVWDLASEGMVSLDQLPGRSSGRCLVAPPRRGAQLRSLYWDAAAKLAAALVKGSTAEADKVATATSHDPTGNRDVKSVLLTPQPITKDNVKLVIDKGYVKASEVCSGSTKAACDTAGIK